MYRNFEKAFALLGMEERGALITAIFEYVMCGKAKTALGEGAKMAFLFITDTLDRDREAYERRCEVNRENGKKGGRPKKEFGEEERADHDAFSPKTKPKKTEKNPTKPKKPDKEKDKEKEKDMDMDIAMDIAKGGAFPPPPEEERHTRKAQKSAAPVSDSHADRSAVHAVSGLSEDSSAVHSVSGLSEQSPSGARFSEPTSGEGLSETQKEGRKKDPFDNPSRSGADDAEWFALLSCGVEEDYVTERWERAKAYAEQSDRLVSEVLLEWWKQDRKPPQTASRNRWGKSAKSPAKEPKGGCTLGNSIPDTDEFFLASIRRTMETDWV
jgi:hypothetical protein